jgi:hypothetical protein
LCFQDFFRLDREYSERSERPVSGSGTGIKGFFGKDNTGMDIFMGLFPIYRIQSNEKKWNFYFREYGNKQNIFSEPLS